MSRSPSTIPPVWRRACDRLRWRVNLGWWWLYFSRILLACAGVTGFLWWLLRLQEAPSGPAWALGAGGVVAGALGAFDAARKRFLSMEVAVDRLDSGWGMEGRVTAALDGVRPWPEAPVDQPLPLVWRRDTPWVPVGLSVLFVGLAAWIPVPPPPAPPVARSEPPEWRTMEAFADMAEERDFLGEEAVRALREDVAALRDKPAESWYDPSTLEATDRLRERTRTEAERLRRDLGTTAALLDMARRERSRMNAEQRASLQETYRELKSRMEQRGMCPSRRLVEGMKKIDLSSVGDMDGRALRELERELSRMGREMEAAMARAGMGPGSPSPNGTGAGGPGRGGGPAALALRDSAAMANPAVPMGLGDGDPENAQVGDVLEEREREHEKERPEVSASAGGVAHEGGGGEVVWREDVLPEEEDVLQRYFD